MHTDIPNGIPENWTPDRVAQWLGYASGESFMKIAGRLTAEHGFPQPLPGIRPVRWSAISLQAWLASMIPASQRKALAETGRSARPDNGWAQALLDRMETGVSIIALESPERTFSEGSNA